MTATTPRRGDPVEVAPAVIAVHSQGPLAVTAAVTPTQMRHPWRSMLRTAFQMLVALAALWPVVVVAAGLPEWAWVGGATAAAAGITRVMALPGVETFLRRFAPFLSAAPAPKES